MRKLLLVLLFVPSICLAFSAECSFFIGVSSNGQITTIGTRDWDGSAFQFGARENPKLRYCESAKNYSFQCRSKRDENPNVIYKSGNYDDNNPPSSDASKRFGIRHKEARAYFKKVEAFIKGKNFKANYDFYFVCDKGCDDKKPLFLYPMSYVECE